MPNAQIPGRLVADCGWAILVAVEPAVTISPSAPRRSLETLRISILRSSLALETRTTRTAQGVPNLANGKAAAQLLVRSRLEGIQHRFYGWKTLVQRSYFGPRKKTNILQNIGDSARIESRPPALP